MIQPSSTRFLGVSASLAAVQTAEIVAPIEPANSPQSGFVVPGVFSERIQQELATATRYPNTRLTYDRQKPSYVDLSTKPVRLTDLMNEAGRIVPDSVIEYVPDMDEEVDLLYALAPWGELRVTWRLPGVYHSSMFGPAQDLVAAGHVYVKDGEVSGINLDSGHFAPDNDASLTLVRRVLVGLNIPLTDDFILDFTRET